MSLVGNFRMDCFSARQHLSAFHDGELKPDLQATVADHLDSCHECAQLLADFQQLSRRTAELPAPAVPPEIWPQLERQLNSQAALPRTTLAQLVQRRRTWIGIATSALLLVAVSTAALVWFNHAEPGHNHVAINFAQYLDEFERNPDAAQEILLSNYEGRAVSFDEAATQVRYRPATPLNLPHGLSREAIYLLRMPCCLCVQAVYKSEDGKRVSVFEHVDDQPIWFGQRPMIQARCNGMPTNLVQVDECLAANWKRDGRYMTLIGARDVEQVAELMASLD